MRKRRFGFGQYFYVSPIVHFDGIIPIRSHVKDAQLFTEIPVQLNPTGIFQRMHTDYMRLAYVFNSGEHGIIDSTYDKMPSDPGTCQREGSHK
jgi:hypothetical protein